MKPKSWHTCLKCGDKMFPKADKKKLGGITCMDGKCPDCGESGTLIPISDWGYASGDKLKWD